MKKKKKIIIVAGFCLLLVVTGILNIFINSNIQNTNPVNSENVNVANFFTSYRSDRTNTRSEELLYLEAIITSNSSSESIKMEAEMQKLEIIAKMEKELAIESLIKSKGFADAVISTLSGSISVIVKSAELTDAEVSQIVEIILTQTDYVLDDIIIIPVE